MEAIGKCDLTQEVFIKAQERYLELKWKLMLKDYKTKEEKKNMKIEKEKINKEWEFEEC